MHHPHDTFARYLGKTLDSLNFEDVEQKLVPLLEKQKRGDIMTIADRLRQEGKKTGIKKWALIGEIKLCKQLLNDDLVQPQLAEQLKARITELHEKLKKSPVAARIDN
jgi:hypothetical protein